MQDALIFRRRAAAIAVFATLGLSACGGGGSSSSDSTSSNAPETISVPAEPAGLGYIETADAPSGVLAYVDTGATNQRNNPCMVTLDTNAGVRVLKGFLDVWAPSTTLVDAGVTLAAANGCAAVTASTWSGVPNDATDGTVKNSDLHTANIGYVKTVTQSRSTAQALAAYMDDRRAKGYSVSDGMGPLTSIWRSGTGQTSTIAAVDPASAVAVVNEGGNNLGLTTSTLGPAVSFIDSGNITDGSGEPAKRFYKYARPWRWSSDVRVVPALESAKSATPATDGGFPSGHTAEAWRDTLPMAYLFPQRFQELITRAMEMGENRILSGMHSPLDVMGGRVQATAVVAYSLNKTAMDKAATYKLVQDYLMAQTGTSDFNALNTYAHTVKTTDTGNANYDRFADYTSNKSFFTQKLTYGLPKIAANDGKAASVPKGAEVLLETRLPYLTAAQRRVVLKTTEIDSGYPLANDEEGWGRLNLFAAADGYGAFNGDVAVSMDASLGGFNARDSWKNDIAGAGKLTKLGTGSLRLSGANTYTGGTVIAAGTLAADAASAFGKGDVFVKGGALECAAPAALAIGGAYTQTAGNLNLVMRGASKGVLAINGTATLAGGTLSVSFSGYTPAVGDTLTVLTAGKRNGSFSSVTVAGFSKVTPIYTATGVQLRLDAI
ncbi:phosphatase PAP2 family protein [Uliginosibacterium sp. 31-16]|uniref:acid phosphatase n=1 Tax=Uliginosibacterium sp. 31-16 TaxID=3068315 RepID=UPI00273F864D|nr:phosphatase PAP2 family protein [Uliginosibacterium sp. 31-16]MDP5238012.1 phosphatase PAP2 family protein [Uliginosibacterium sp. 31-16]